MKKPKTTPAIDTNLIDSLIKQYDNPMDIFCENGLMMQLKKAIVERVMELCYQVKTKLEQKPTDGIKIISATRNPQPATRNQPHPSPLKALLQN